MANLVAVIIYPNTHINTLKETYTLSEKLLLALLAVIFAFKLFVLLYFINAGFDFTDEGIVMLWFAYPEADPNPFYYFHIMVSRFLPFIEWNLINTRLATIVSELVVIGVIGAVVRRYTQVPKLLAWGVVSLGFFMSILSRAYYEGDISYLFTTISLSVPLLFYREESNKKMLWGALIAGVFIGLQFFNKFSSSLLNFVFVLGALTYLQQGWRALLGLLVGTVAGLSAFFPVTGYAPTEWWAEYQLGYELVVESLGYDIGGLLLFYSVDAVLVTALAILPVGLAYLAKRSMKLGTEGLANALVIATSTLMVVYYLLLPWPYSDAHYHLHSLLINYWFIPLVAGILFVLFNTPLLKLTRIKQVLLFFLLMIPAVSMVGTGTSLAVSIIAYLIPWFGLFMILAYWFFRPVLVKHTAVLAVLVTMIFTCFQVIEPYRMLAPIYQQTNKIDGPRETVYLADEEWNFVNDTKEYLQAEGMPRKYPIVALYNQPGLVYLVGGYSPATPWYWDVSWLKDENAPLVQDVHDFSCMHLGRVKLFENRLPIFMIHSKFKEQLRVCMEDNGFFLERDYKEPFIINDPLLEKQHRYTTMDGATTLEIYVPRQPMTN